MGSELGFLPGLETCRLYMVPEKGDIGGVTGGTSVALQPPVLLESSVEGLLLRLNAFAFFLQGRFADGMWKNRF